MAAVVRLVDDGVTIGDLSVERIARTAGVGKATVYRRWATKESLCVDVIRSMAPDPVPMPGTSVRDDLVAVLENVRRHHTAHRAPLLVLDVLTHLKTLPRLWEVYTSEVIEPWQRSALAVLRRGVADGEIRSDVDVTLLNDLLISPVLVRSVLMPPEALCPDLPERVVDTLLAGLGAQAPG
ncbi:TetR/AcrR family transcriptional regulator [Streptomyces sp. NPDC006314]|uniref:TetR/AcrR family transcriptional regulator n=1 Tax=Streptomyces sp. NPDC006314 TaxID=3154475 RepID=UPI0033B8C279